MKKISDLFYLESGNGLALNKLVHKPQGVAFVSRTSKNNGVSSFVEMYNNIQPFSAGLITVALSGNSVLESFVQPFDFYTGYHVMVLTPKKEMSLQEKIYFCLCIKQNRFKYNFGRQANRTLGDLIIPDYVPEELYKLSIKSFDTFNAPFAPSELSNNLDISKWKLFYYKEIFEVESGKGVLLGEAKKHPGKYPIVSATRLNNAIATFTSFEPTHKGNSIAIIKNGVNVGTAFYQECDFSATTDVAVLIPKFPNNVYISLFLTTLINKDSYRYNYGRKWGVSAFNKATILLPCDDYANPNWSWMESYIKSLSYSQSLQ